LSISIVLTVMWLEAVATQITHTRLKWSTSFCIDIYINNFQFKSTLLPVSFCTTTSSSVSMSFRQLHTYCNCAALKKDQSDSCCRAGSSYAAQWDYAYRYSPPMQLGSYRPMQGESHYRYASRSEAHAGLVSLPVCNYREGESHYLVAYPGFEGGIAVLHVVFVKCPPLGLYNNISPYQP
jgi:hypothetical protein